ncbi:unnamed protein product [Miscanthus lutarioriparius]|uniref:Uncharacterized protein n=1 Tax=Miscanthus lutarioriparius TaxID=422564 RepID=A0A811MYM0_9POAL|nr:unnamed protein product [Miscanthus lutarioriparius]
MWEASIASWWSPGLRRCKEEEGGGRIPAVRRGISGRGAGEGEATLLAARVRRRPEAGAATSGGAGPARFGGGAAAPCGPGRGRRILATRTGCFDTDSGTGTALGRGRRNGRRRGGSGGVAAPRVSTTKKRLGATGGERDLVSGAAGGQHVDALGADDDVLISVSPIRGGGGVSWWRGIGAARAVETLPSVERIRLAANGCDGGRQERTARRERL